MREEDFAVWLWSCVTCLYLRAFTGIWKSGRTLCLKSVLVLMYWQHNVLNSDSQSVRSNVKMPRMNTNLISIKVKSQGLRVEWVCIVIVRKYIFKQVFGGINGNDVLTMSAWTLPLKTVLYVLSSLVIIIHYMYVFFLQKYTFICHLNDLFMWFYIRSYSCELLRKQKHVFNNRL